MSLIIDVPVRPAEIAVKVAPLAPAEMPVRKVGTLLSPDHALLGLQPPCFARRQLTGADSTHDRTVLPGLHPVDARA